MYDEDWQDMVDAAYSSNAARWTARANVGPFRTVVITAPTRAEAERRALELFKCNRAALTLREEP